MTRVNVAEAKAKLARLIDAALQGEEVIIARRNRPVVRLVALRNPKSPIGFGALRGSVRISPDFEQPLDDFAAYAPPRGRKRAGKR